MKEYYRVSEAAKLIGVQASTLRKYADSGRIQSTRNPGGHRVFSLKHIKEFLGEAPESIKPVVVFYVRSSDGDERKLKAQTQFLTQKYGEPVRVFKDKASGLNEKRPGLISLLDNAKKGKFNTLVITQKDRLTRFGFSYLERLLDAYGVQVIVSGEPAQKTLHEELLQDFMSLIASFSGKFYRLRGYQQQQKLLTKAQDVLDGKNPNQ